MNFICKVAVYKETIQDLKKKNLSKSKHSLLGGCDNGKLVGKWFLLFIITTEFMAMWLSVFFSEFTRLFLFALSFNTSLFHIENLCWKSYILSKQNFGEASDIKESVFRLVEKISCFLFDFYDIFFM